MHQSTGRTLESFICPRGLGEFSPWDIEGLDPLRDRPLLITISDEESSQFRALNLLFGVMKVRGMPLPEACHPTWNDASRALQSSGLKPAILKGTLLANHYRGPFKSGRFGFELATAARKLMLTCSDSYLENISMGFAYDIGDPRAVLTREAFLNSPGIATRLPIESCTIDWYFLCFPPQTG